VIPSDFTKISGIGIHQSKEMYLQHKINTKKLKLECGPMPKVMAALPNIGGALCSTLQSLADAHY